MKVNAARVAGGILISFVVIGFLIYILKLIEPASPIQNLFLSNITDHQATLSWITGKPTRGQILLSEDNRFPLLPFWSKKWEKDDGEKSLNTTNFYLTHHITIGDLKPNQTYYFRIYQGWKSVYQGSFKTGITLSSILNPNPVYGRVLSSDQKTPVVGAIVYLGVEKEASNSSILSTLTNKEGGWSLDLANLRSRNLYNFYLLEPKLATTAAEVLIVESGDESRFTARTKIGQDKPWPNIILK